MTFAQAGGGIELVCTYQYGVITLSMFQTSSDAAQGYATTMQGLPQDTPLPGIGDQAFVSQHTVGPTIDICAVAQKGTRMVTACYQGNFVPEARVEAVLGLRSRTSDGARRPFASAHPLAALLSPAWVIAVVGGLVGR